MPSWPAAITEFLWQNALAAIPLVLIVAAITKFLPCRPSTRHFLWLLVLVLLLAPRISPPEQISQLIATAFSPDEDTVATPVVAVGNQASGFRPQRPEFRRSTPEPPPTEEKLQIGRVGLDPPSGDRRGSVPQQVGPDPPYRIAPESYSQRGDSRCPEPVYRRRANPAPPRIVARTPPQRRDAVRSGRIPQRGESRPSRSSVRKNRPAEPMSKPRGVTTRTIPSESSLPKIGVPTPAVALNPQSSEVPRTRPITPDDRNPIWNIAGNAQQTPVPLATRASDLWRKSVSQLRTQWAVWREKLAGLSSLILGLPPVPTTIWLGGVAVLMILSLYRMRRFQRLLVQAVPAGKAVTSEVARAASEMGLKRPPTTVMIGQRISPMILCGPRPRLILPQQLWSELDEVGRHAVICHELAHLRRRDHVVTWIEWLVGLIYWWNPLVWWVRQRLHEEAELSCDQWVTWLLPRDRRAYAVALLRAKEYVSRTNIVAPAMSMGATSKTTRKFTRRIKMVMTATARPRLSVIGIALACALAATTWVSASAWACPPKAKKARAAASKCASCTDSCKCKCKKSECQGKCCSNCATRAKAATVGVTDEAKSGLSTFEQYISGKEDSKGKKARKAKKAKKAKQAKKAKKAKAAKHKQKPKKDAKYSVGPPAAPQNPSYTAFQRGGDDSRERERFEEQLERRLERRLRQLEERLLERFSEEMEHRIRERPPGVPRNWRPLAPPDAPQPWFGPESDDAPRSVRSYRLPEGKLKALADLMIRSDVPVLVTPREDRIEVHGTPAQQRIFRAFVNMIHPPAGADAKEAVRQENLASEALVQRVYMESQARAMEVQSRMLEQRSQEFGERAEQLQRRAEELQSAAEGLQDRMKERALGQASALIAEAQALESQAHADDTEAVQLDEHSVLLQERSEALLELLNVLQEQAKRAAQQSWWVAPEPTWGRLAVEVPSAIELAPAIEMVPLAEPFVVAPLPVPVRVLTPATVPVVADVAPEPTDVGPKR